jgi:hypothetical protein
VLICLTAVEFVGGRGNTDDAAAQDAETAQAVNTAMAAMN